MSFVIKGKIKNSPGIYKITNLANGKIYVGSSKNVKQRMREHFNCLCGNRHSNRHLQFSWNKYGEENFSYEIIEYVDIPENLLTREQFWIDLTDCCNQMIGYNLAPTAGNCLGLIKDEETRKLHKYSQKSKPILQIDLKGNIVREWFSVKEIHRELGFTITFIKKCCKMNNKIGHGFIWIYKENLKEFDLKTYMISFGYVANSNARERVVLQYSKNGTLLNEWKSIKEAGIALNIDRTSISQCCREKKKTAGGYIWKYKDYEPDYVYEYVGNRQYQRRQKEDLYYGYTQS